MPDGGTEFNSLDLFAMLETLTPGEEFLDGAAARLLAMAGGGADLSSHLVLVSSLPLAAELRSTLARVAGRPLLLPRFDTLRRWAMAAPLPDMPVPMPDSERLVLLHAALAERGWFDERALWGIASELALLADELSAAAVRLPDDVAGLEAQLVRAYALRNSQPLAFEARVVHEMWRVLAVVGRPDTPSVYRLRLAALARSAGTPLFMLVDGPPEERLSAAECQFLGRYAERQPVRVVAPVRRGEVSRGLGAVLAAAWPEPMASGGEGGARPLLVRAEALRASGDSGQGCPFAERLQLVPVRGREAEARTCAAQVLTWLAEGRRRIALIAEDRLTARRVRALLEREGVLAADETGWKMSTTRTAATFDALLETVATSGWHADVLDLLKSPHMFADLEAAPRGAAVLALEHTIRRHGVKSGLPAMRRALADEVAAGWLSDAQPVLGMIDRLAEALVILGGRPAPLPRWIARLIRALERLGGIELLAADAAGAEILELLAQRQEELVGNAHAYDFSSFRDWFGRELEAGSFRDRSIASPIVMLPRHDVRLRRFEAALVIGADAAQLKPTLAGGSFFNQSVRRELGLPSIADAETALRRDLELLLQTVPEVVVTWQCERDGEARLLAPEFDLLSTLHRLAWGDDLHRPPPASRPELSVDPETSPSPPIRSAPAVPLALIPSRLSVSGLASLVACPYQFFARHVLRLNELDDVSEEMEKSDYGALVHRSLERFHAMYPRVLDLAPGAALAALTAIVADTFAEAEADNWLALGWRLRWQSRLADYLEWQRDRERAGWFWASAESKAERAVSLASGGEITLYGRIDRTDSGPDGASLLDYKTQNLQRLRERLDDDVQLSAYALLVGEQGVAEAAFVALDDTRPASLACRGDVRALARAQGERLAESFSQMRQGTPLPAHGAEIACAWCEMAGLCRRDHVVCA